MAESRFDDKNLIETPGWDRGRMLSLTFPAGKPKTWLWEQKREFAK